jgi:hypothetical protein
VAAAGGFDAIGLLHSVPFRSRSLCIFGDSAGLILRDASLRMRDGSFVSLGTKLDLDELMAAYNLYHARLKVCTVAVTAVQMVHGP